MERIRFLLILLCLFLALSIPTAVDAAKARILIYSATRDFRHDSIPTAIEALKARQDSINAQFDNTEDQTQFTDDVLSNYDTILFLSTTGEVLDSAGKDAFQKYLDLGGTFVGIHSASDTLRNTTFYTDELGSLFDYHPALQNFTVDVLDTTHPSTSMLPVIWGVQDEAYNFKSDPRTLGATVILAANESSYIGMKMLVCVMIKGLPIPLHGSRRKALVWKPEELQVAVSTRVGPSNETWQDDLFLSHVLGGISWVLLGNTTRAFNTSGLVGNAQSEATQSGNAPSKASNSTSTSATAGSANSQMTIHSSARNSKPVANATILILLSIFLIHLQ